MLADVGDDVGQVDGLAVALDAAVVFVAGHGQAIAVQNDIELALFGGKCSVHDKLHGMVIGFPREGLDGKLKIHHSSRSATRPLLCQKLRQKACGRLTLVINQASRKTAHSGLCQILLMVHLPFLVLGLWSSGDAGSTWPAGSFMDPLSPSCVILV